MIERAVRLQTAEPELPTVIPADRRLRRNALLILLIAAIAAYPILGIWLPRLQQQVGSGQISGLSVCIAFLVCLLAIVIPVLWVGVSIRRRGKLAVSSQQFPPAGERTLIDTRILRGRPAVLFGRVQMVLGASLVLLSSILFGVTSYALVLLLN
jgi:hypothetical protein